jgi:hypothetical protein
MNKISGYVYLIGSPIFCWYKIGKSKTPEIRIKDLGILLPFKINIIGIWSAADHSLLETTLHEMYKDHRINGEWFSFGRKEVYAMVFDRLPKESRYFPSENETENKFFDRFSNVEFDEGIAEGRSRNKRGKVIGVRVQKLRGDFTLEEREERKIASIEEKRRKKEQKLKIKVDEDSSI